MAAKIFVRFEGLRLGYDGEFNLVFRPLFRRQIHLGQAYLRG